MRFTIRFSLICLLVNLAALIFFTGCCGGRVSNLKDVVGTYDGSSDFAGEIIELLASGEYKQQVTFISSGKKVCSAGHWSFDPIDGCVVFESNLLLVVTGHGDLNPDAESPVGGLVRYPTWMCGRLIQFGDGEYVSYRRR